MQCAAISIEHLLIGLLDSKNLAFLGVLHRSKISPSSLRETIERLRKNALAALTQNPAVADLCKAARYGASQELKSVYWRMLCRDELFVSAPITLPRLLLALTNDRYSTVAAVLNQVGLSRLDLVEQVRIVSAGADVSIAKTVAKVLASAGALAVLLGNAEVGCEHVLLALVAWQRRHQGENILPDPINLTYLEAQLYLALAHYDGRPLALNTNLSEKFDCLHAGAKLLIARAIVVAVQSGRSYIDTEHLFLACMQSSLFALESFGAAASWPGLEARVSTIISRYSSPVVPAPGVSFSISVRLLDLILRAISDLKDSEPATVGDADGPRLPLLSVDRLLQALLAEPEGLVPVILQELGCPVEKLR